MTRIIRVTKCAECPYQHLAWKTGHPFCGKSERMIWLTDTSLVHELCPLERAETKGASEDE